jgi:radical SAM protein with 4Fe4S-binding SPASM domain
MRVKLKPKRYGLKAEQVNSRSNTMRPDNVRQTLDLKNRETCLNCQQPICKGQCAAVGGRKW